MMALMGLRAVGREDGDVKAVGRVEVADELFSSTSSGLDPSLFQSLFFGVRSMRAFFLETRVWGAKTCILGDKHGRAILQSASGHGCAWHGLLNIWEELQLKRTIFAQIEQADSQAEAD